MRLLVLLTVLASLLLTPGTVNARSSYATVHTRVGFSELFSLTTDSEGNLYAVDQGQRQIVEFSPAGRLVQRFRLPVKCGAISDVAVAPSGALYAVSICSGWIYEFSASGRILARFGHPVHFNTGQNNTVPYPTGILVNAHGTLYVSYRMNANSATGGRIDEMSTTGKVLRTFFHSRSITPDFMATDDRGNVYLSTDDRGLYVISPEGRVIGHWGTGPGKSLIISPGHPATDAQGNVYINDTLQSYGDIMKFSPRGRFLGNIVHYGFHPQNTINPVGVTIDGRGHIFVAQQLPNEISEYSRTGTLLAIWQP